MAATLVCDALAEANGLIAKRRRQKAFVLNALYTSGTLQDPTPGGSDAADTVAWADIVASESRLQVLLGAIAKADGSTNCTIPLGGVSVTRTLAEWAVWRDDIARPRVEFLEAVLNKFAEARGQVIAGRSVKIEMNEASIATELDTLRSAIAVLESKVSVLNATTTVDV